MVCLRLIRKGYCCCPGKGIVIVHALPASTIYLCLAAYPVGITERSGNSHIIAAQHGVIAGDCYIHGRICRIHGYRLVLAAEAAISVCLACLDIPEVAAENKTITVDTANPSMNI